MVRIGLLMLCVGWASACFVLPVPAPTKVLEGRRSASMDLSFLRPGVTSPEEAKRWLGPPTAWLQAQRILVYGARYTERELLVGAGAAGGGATARVPLVKAEGLFLAFDEDARLLAWGGGPVASDETWLGGALRWAKSADCTVPSPAKAFGPGPLPPGSGRLVLYCTQRESWRDPDFFPAVVLDGQPCGQLRKGAYLSLEVEAGCHDLIALPDTRTGPSPAQVRRPGILQLQLHPGQVAYAELRVESGLLASAAHLVPRDPPAALKALASLKETW